MFSPATRLSALGLAIGLLLATTYPGTAEDKKPEGEKIELKVGDAAPVFELRTDADSTWSSSERVGKKWLVIYFAI